jgi:hypothetical protein
MPGAVILLVRLTLEAPGPSTATASHAASSRSAATSFPSTGAPSTCPGDHEGRRLDRLPVWPAGEQSQGGVLSHYRPPSSVFSVPWQRIRREVGADPRRRSARGSPGSGPIGTCSSDDECAGYDPHRSALRRMAGFGKSDAGFASGERFSFAAVLSREATAPTSLSATRWLCVFRAARPGRSVRTQTAAPRPVRRRPGPRFPAPGIRRGPGGAACAVGIIL